MLDLKPYEKTTGSVIPLYCLLVHNHSTLQQQESSEQSAIWLKQNLHRSHTWYLSFCRSVTQKKCFQKERFFHLKLGKIVASTGMVISVGHHARKIQSPSWKKITQNQKEGSEKNIHFQIRTIVNLKRTRISKGNNSKVDSQMRQSFLFILDYLIILIIVNIVIS